MFCLDSRSKAPPFLEQRNKNLVVSVSALWNSFFFRMIKERFNKKKDVTILIAMSLFLRIRCKRLREMKCCSKRSRVAPAEATVCCPPERRFGAICRRLFDNCKCKRNAEAERARNTRAKHSLTSVAPPPLSEVTLDSKRLKKFEKIEIQISKSQETNLLQLSI